MKKVNYPELLSGYRKPAAGKTAKASINKPLEIIVHHTGGTDKDPLADTSHHTFETVNAYHKTAFNFKSSLGFYIGYHDFIDKTGKITKGRADTDEGAHTLGYNNKSLGVCLAGNFDSTYPTKAQEVALKKYIQEKTAKYGIPLSKVGPHRMHSAKTCYGKLLSNTWAQDLLNINPPTSNVRAEIESIIKRLQEVLAKL